MSKAVFQEELGGSTTIQAQDTAGTFTLQLPAADGTLVHTDPTGTATFADLSLTGAVIAGAWDADTIEVEHGGTGAVTLTGYVIASGTSPMTASATIPNTDITGLGNMSVQDSDSVTITGGTANGLTIGAVNPAAVTATTLRVNSTVSLAGNTGAAGQVLTSNGVSAPTWESIPGTGTVTSIDVSGGTTGLTTSGGPITSNGTITLAGTLAVASGGTGSTTAPDALTALGAYPASNPAGYTTNTGTVTSVGGTGTVNGLSLSGTVTTSGDLTLGGTLDLSAPPAIGGTTAAAVTGTTITANTKFVGPYFDAASSAGGALRTSSGAACLQWGGGGAVNLTLDGPFNMNPANSTVSIAPTGTGTATINPATAGTINNMSLGVTTPAEVKVTVGWAANTALTDAATIAWDSTNQIATFTFVSTNRTMDAPTNLKNGAFYALAVIQNAGSNTLTWNSVFKWAGGVAPTLSTGAGAKDYFTFRSDGTNLYEQGRSLGVA